MRTQILLNPGETVIVEVERDGAIVELTAVLEEQEDGTGYLGVQPTFEQKDLGVIGGLGLRGQDHRRIGGS